MHSQFPQKNSSNGYVSCMSGDPYYTGRGCRDSPSVGRRSLATVASCIGYSLAIKRTEPSRAAQRNLRERSSDIGLVLSEHWPGSIREEGTSLLRDQTAWRTNLRSRDRLDRRRRFSQTAVIQRAVRGVRTYGITVTKTVEILSAPCTPRAILSKDRRRGLQRTRMACRVRTLHFR